MSGPTITGSKGAYLQPQRFGINESGGYAILTWEGTANEVKSNIPAILSMGGLYDYQDSFSGAKCQLTARFPLLPGVQETPIDTWEFFAAVVEKDVLEADNSIINGLSETEKRQIRTIIQDPSAGTPAPLGGTNANKIYQLMLTGLRAIRVNAPTLRHTQTVSNNWTVKASFANVSRLISTASLIATEAVPSAILFNLPTDVSVRAGFQYAWMKNHPTVRASAFQKMQIEQEWQYGLWPVDPLILGSVI